MYIGITMRQLEQPGTGDLHDALSQDWGRFLAAAGLRWLPLPNREEETLALALEMKLSGFIFSGGGTTGQEPPRDHTEALLLAMARQHSLPVLGVCRGFQTLQRLLGGELTPVAGHVATRHALHPVARAPQFQREVNSYHQQGILCPAPGLEPLACSLEADGSRYVEAASGCGLLGVMWHPERNPTPHAADVALVQNLFKTKSWL